jgi:hypothetical protein
MERGAERGGQKGLSGAAPARRYASVIRFFLNAAPAGAGEPNPRLGANRLGLIWVARDQFSISESLAVVSAHHHPAWLFVCSPFVRSSADPRCREERASASPKWLRGTSSVNPRSVVDFVFAF